MCFQSQKNFFVVAEEKLSHLIRSVGMSSISSPAVQPRTPIVPPQSMTDRRQDTRISVSLCFMWYLGLIRSYEQQVILKNMCSAIGDASSANPKPWILHTCEQEPSSRKRFNRERPEKPEEEESSGLFVSYPITTTCVTSGLSGFTKCK